MLLIPLHPQSIRANIHFPIHLSLDGCHGIEWSRFAVCAEVINAAEDFPSWGDAIFIEIITHGMLPGVASFAVHSVSIVILKATDAFDGIFFIDVDILASIVVLIRGMIGAYGSYF